MKKIVSSVVSLLIAAVIVIVVGVGSSGFKNWNVSEWFKGEQVQDNSEYGNMNESGVKSDNGAMISGETYVMPASMIYARTTAESQTAAQGVRIKAFVEPETALDQTVDFVTAFENPASEWATGKSVSDYVTVTPDSDGSQYATVECLADFGEPIIIKAVSRQNPNAEILQTCKVDFAQRVASATMYFASTFRTLSTTASVDIPITINIGSAETNNSGILRVDFKLSDTYTVAQEYSTAATFSHNSSSYLGDSEYVAYTETASMGHYVVHGYKNLVLGETYHLDKRFFEELKFGEYTDCSDIAGSYTSPWVRADQNYAYWGISMKDLKEQFYDGVFGDKSDAYQNKKLWDFAVTLQGEYFAFEYSGAIRWGSITGWDTVQGSGVGSENGGSGVVV